MKHLLSCTALALLLATGSAYAADDAAQPNAPQPDAAAPNAAQSDQALPNAPQSDAAAPNAAQSDQVLPGAAQSDIAGPNTGPRDQAATPSEEQTPTARSDELPGGSLPISAYYNQTVYDDGDNKIGDVNDLLLDDSGKINAAIIGVGGILGVGEKNVAVPFSLLKVADKDGSHYLVLEANKEALQSAPGYIYDSGKKIWLPATKQG
jgi:PRC-barrel domain protein